MERAELLCDKDDGKRRKLWMVLSLLVGVVAPVVAVLPFVFGLERDGDDDPSRKGLMASSVWVGCLQGYVEVIYLYQCVSTDLLNFTNTCFAVQ